MSRPETLPDVTASKLFSEPRSELHRAARIDIAIMRLRARRVRALGYRPSVIGYTGYGSTSWVRLLARVLLTRDSRRARGEEPTGSRGWRSFISVPVENGLVDVAIGKQSFTVRADSSGIVDTRIEVDLEPGWHRAELSSEGSTPTPADVYVVDPEVRFGIVSDIDDTVMVTALPRPLLAAWHTFVVNEHARTSTPGMPVLYERLVTANEQTPVIYLSTGAWNVAPTLTRFLSRNLYPKGALLLTDWGPTADRWFRSGREHKRNSLERLATEFPQIRWLLIGDDGQHDEAIYSEFAASHPDQVAAVCIRQLTPGEAVLAGSTNRASAAAAISQATWLYANDGAELSGQLARLGLITHHQQQPEVPA
jgi:phosphatidate phosphatase APP1